MKKYEYMIELEYAKNLPVYWLNTRGQDGWELVSVVQDSDTDGTALHRYYFKREIK